jgi:hypothetical protein
MATHEGFIFVAPDGRYLIRREILRHGGNTQTTWELTTCLDAAEIFAQDELDPIKPGQGFEDLARDFDVSIHQLRDYLSPLPAKSFQRIQIGGGSWLRV